jgi:hypothetical protein
MIAKSMTQFINDIVATGKSATSQEAVEAMKPFIDAMILEGS